MTSAPLHLAATSAVRVLGAADPTNFDGARCRRNAAAVVRPRVVPTFEPCQSSIEVPRARASRVLRFRTPVLWNTDLR